MMKVAAYIVEGHGDAVSGLHPSILEEEDNFETIRESCPGINKDISYEEFCVILRTILDDDVMEINSLK